MNRRIRLALATAGAAVFIRAFAHPCISDSLPLKWVVAVPWGAVHRGDLVMFCPPLPVAREVVDRGYMRTRGPCPGNSLTFLKLVAAVGGDVIAVDARGVSVNGRRALPSSVALARDPSGRPMSTQPYGVRRVPAGSLWVYGTNPGSFDSRYFGPIDRGDVRDKVIGYVAYAPLPDLR